MNKEYSQFTPTIIISMSQFLKLTTVILNKRMISRINIENKSYKLFIEDMDWSGFMVCGSGYADNNSTSTLVIKEQSDRKDYQIITDWINKMD